jgi:hypothetical protein
VRIWTSDNDALDFHTRCAPSEEVARKRYANRGDGPDGRGNCFGYDDDHPSYDGEGYRCTTCKKPLTDANA